MESATLTPGGRGGYSRGRLATAGNDAAFGAGRARLEASRRGALRAASPLQEAHVRETTRADTIAAAAAVAHFPLD